MVRLAIAVHHGNHGTCQPDLLHSSIEEKAHVSPWSGTMLMYFSFQGKSQLIIQLLVNVQINFTVMEAAGGNIYYFIKRVHRLIAKCDQVPKKMLKISKTVT